MKITLIGSCKFENEYKFWNELLTLRGHLVYSVAVLPSDKDGEKDWYSERQKKILDHVHLKKIIESDKVFVITQALPSVTGEGMKRINGYVGKSTESEITWAVLNGKVVVHDYDLNFEYYKNQMLKQGLAIGTDL